MLGKPRYSWNVISFIVYTIKLLLTLKTSNGEITKEISNVFSEIVSLKKSIAMQSTVRWFL